MIDFVRDIPRLLVVLTHHDDESLFVGGLLHARSLAGKETFLATVCDVSVENALPPGPAELERQQRRLEAYQKASHDLSLSGLLRAEPYELLVKLNIQASHFGIWG